MHRVFFKVASVLAALSVMLGAFGAHLLKKHLSAEDLNGYHTAVNYQMIHAIGLFIVGMMYRHYKTKKNILAGYFFILGTFFFCGSIYLRLLFNAVELSFGRYTIMFAPVGGLFFMLGWIFILLSIPTKKRYAENIDKEG